MRTITFTNAMHSVATSIRILTFSLLLFAMRMIPAHAQMPRLYTMEQELPSTHISASYIDNNGILWIMGERMLTFFDGHRFHKVFDNDSDFAMRTNLIYSMLQIDERRFLIATGFGLYVMDGRTFAMAQIDLGEKTSNTNMPGFPVSSMTFIDNGTKIVVTTSGFGATVLDAKTLKPQTELTKTLQASLNDQFVYISYLDSKGHLLVSTSVDPLVCLDSKTLKRLPVTIDDELRQRINNGCPVNCICEIPNTHDLLIGASGIGLMIYNSETSTVRTTKGNNPSLAPRSIICTKLEDVFVGTDNAGIVQWDSTTESTEQVTWEVPGVDMAVGKVHHLAEDQRGNLIVTLYQKGVMIVPSHINKMTYIPVSRTANGINSSPVSCLLHEGGKFWIGTDGSGVFSASNHQFTAMGSKSEGLNLKLMTCITTDADGKLWSSSYGGGVQVWNGEQWTTPAFVESLRSQNVLWMECDKKENCLYVCINGVGLYEVNIRKQSTRKVSEIDEYANRWVSFALVDSHRNLWVVYATGLGRLNLTTGKSIRIDLGDMSGAQVNDMVEMNGKVYIGTSSGLVSCSYTDEKVTTESASSELADVNIMSLLAYGNDLWVASANSLACVRNVDKKKGEGMVVDNYTSFPGFYIGQLHQRSRIVGNEGFVCFGGDNGIVAVKTKNNVQHTRGGQEVKAKTVVDKILITGLFVNGESVEYNPNNEKNLLDCTILCVDEIELSHKDNSFTVDFGSVEYAHSDEIEYLYRLEGHEDIWHSAPSAQASYSSVPPGHYTLCIRARYEGSDEWTERSIPITINQPWYLSWWAIIAYVLLASLIVWNFYRARKERRAQHEKLQELQHNEQIKEAKLRLFTSIAHELRSPLTMIVSPLKQLKASDTNGNRQSMYDVMQRNCDRLLNIVKQITDVRKIDNGQLQLHFSEFNFVDYCNNILEAFKGMATTKNIKVQHSSDSDDIKVWADEVHLEKVVINLLSNAFKFTPNDGQVLIRTEVKNNDGVMFANKGIKQYLQCSVYNSGSHIDEADLEHIYERFYQGKAKSKIAGSGIGLNLTYELMKLHHGCIKASNTEPDGVEFTFYLPMGNIHLTEEELTPREPEVSDNEAEQQCNQTQIATLEHSIATEQNLDNQEGDGTRKKKTLLVVDDDKEICEYMRSQLETEYNVIVAFSGNSAWRHVLAVRPDVVITDLMMPDGNGIELSHNIKQNAETAHIPVIMLTAEIGEQAQLQSMSADVDRFLGKPFNIDLVRGALGQVLRVRENLLSKANRAEIEHDYENVEMESYEDKFYTRVNDIIKHNIDDSSFTVEALARQVGISRVHLNRKLKEHYGMSPNAFIRSVRLKQAAYLLVNNKVNISEVAYKVGFASHSYFSNNFHDYFGMTPTEFVAYYSDPDNEENLAKLLE